MRLWFVTIGQMKLSDKGRNVLIGIAVFILFILAALFLFRRRQTNVNPVFSPLPTANSLYRQKLQDNYGITVPSTAITADLKDVTGGNQVGLATFDKSSGQNEYSVLANLEDPVDGYFYQAWLVRGTIGSSNYDVISLGQLELAKAGYLLSYTTTKDFSDHKTVWVTLEKYLTNAPSKHILEGNF